MGWEIPVSHSTAVAMRRVWNEIEDDHTEENFELSNAEKATLAIGEDRLIIYGYPEADREIKNLFRDLSGEDAWHALCTVRMDS